MATPRADSYSAASGATVYAGRFSDTFLSNEAGVGSYDSGAFAWTPARASDGRITQQSFDALPTGVWISIAGTGFTSQVQPLLTAAMPTYTDLGNTGLAMVLDGYSGVAHDVVGGRLFAHGGGHVDSANNGIYRLDLAKMIWAIAKLPDLQTTWDVNYRAGVVESFTTYPRADAYCAANPTTTTVGWDEFYDPVTPAASTRNPTSRHTYEALTFYGGKLRYGVRRYWEWDEATGIWTGKYPFDRTYGTHYNAGTVGNSECVKGTWDEVKNRYICTPTQNGSPGDAWSYDADTSAWSMLGFVPTSYQAYWATMARAGRKWVSFTRPTLEGSYWPPKAYISDLDADTISNIALTGLDITKCVSDSRYTESTIMAYCAANDKFLAFMAYDLNNSYADGAALPLEPFWIDLAAGTITHEAQLGAAPSLSTYSLVKNKFVYVPQLSCLLMISSGTSNIILRKF